MLETTRLLTSLVVCALTQLALIGCDDSDSRGPEVLGLQIGLNAEQAKGALRNIDSLEFQRSGGAPSLKVPVKAIVSVNNEAVQLVESNGSLVVGGKVFFFGGWQDTSPCYLTVSKAADVNAMVEAVKSALRESQSKSLSEQLELAKQALNTATKTEADRREHFSRVWAKSRDAFLKLAESELNKLLATVGADGSAEARVQELLTELQVAKAKCKEMLREAPDDAKLLSQVEMIEKIENAATVLVQGGRPRLELAAAEAAFPMVREFFAELGSSAESARNARIDEAQIREGWDRNKQEIERVFAKDGSSLDLRQLVSYLRFDSIDSDGKKRVPAADGLYEEVSAAGQLLSKARTACADAAAEVERISSLLRNIEVREVLVEVGDEQVLVDDAVQVILTIANDKVSRIVLTEEFCNRNFGAKELSDAQFLLEFCKAYGIPALEALTAATVDEAVKNSSLEQQVDFATKKAVFGAKGRVYEDRDSGYRFVMKGKMVMIEAIQRTSDTSLGR